MDVWSTIEALCERVNSKEIDTGHGVSLISTSPVSGNELRIALLIGALIGKQMTFLNSKWDFCSSLDTEQKYTISMYKGPGEEVRDPHLLRINLSLVLIQTFNSDIVSVFCTCVCVCV